MIQPDTEVLTPLNRRALVRSRTTDGLCKLRYLDSEGDEVDLHESLLRPFLPGRERPEPVRVR